MVESIEFYNSITGAPIATVSGEKAKWFAEHSDYIKTVKEMDPTQKHLRVDVSFPTDRVQTFQKILKGYPLGKYNSQGQLSLYKLGPQEERNIQKAVGNNETNQQEERSRVILEILQYLMIPEDLYQGLLVVDQYTSPNKLNKIEQRRRRMITQKRKPTELPFLNEDTIENAVEKHKNYLYGRYAGNPRTRFGLSLMMNRGNIQARDKIFQNEHTRRKQRSNQIVRSVNALRQQITQKMVRGKSTKQNEAQMMALLNESTRIMRERYPFESVHHPMKKYIPKEVLKTMTPVQLERYLRSQRKKGEEKYLEPQEVQIGTFFNEE